MSHNPQAPNEFNGTGNPNGNVAGNAAGATSTFSPADLYVDKSTGAVWTCTTTGNAASAVWVPAYIFGTTQIAALTTTQLALLTSELILPALTTSQITSLTTTQLSAFTSTQTSALLPQITTTQLPNLPAWSMWANSTSTNAPALTQGTGIYLGGSPLVTVNVLMGHSSDPGAATYNQINVQNVNATSGQTGYTATSSNGSDTTHYAGFYKNNATGPSASNAFWTNPYASSWYDIDSEMNIAVGTTLGAGNASMRLFAGQYATANMILKNGLTMSGATGGDLGVGTINAQGLYVNGSPVGTGATPFTWEQITSSTTMIANMGFNVTSSSVLTCTLPTALTANDMYALITTGTAATKIAVPTGITLVDPVWGTVTAGGNLYVPQNSTAWMLATTTTQIEVISGRGNLSLNGSLGPSTDPNYPFVGFLLRASAGNAWSDLSFNAYSIANTGSVTTSGSNTKQDLYSSVFSGANYLKATGSSLGFSSDYTIEFWAYPTTTGQSGESCIVGGSGIGPMQIIQVPGAYTVSVALSGTGQIATSTGSMTQNAWNHVVVMRQNLVDYFAINGVWSGSGADATNYSASTIYIGGTGAANNYFTGSLAGLRISLFSGRYSRFQNFTPPAAPFPANSY